MATDRTRVQIQNLKRDKLHIPVEKAPKGSREAKFIVIGDAMDTDDKIGGIDAPPGTVRDQGLQPAPVLVMTAEEYEELGALAHTIIEDQVAQKRLSVTRLAA